MDLSNFITKDSNIEIEFPGCEGFMVSLSYLSREELLKIRKKCIKIVINKKRQPTEDVDEELFLKTYIPAVVRGWSGLKLSYILELVPADIGDIDPEKELDYTKENAIQLMSNSTVFDSWVSEVISDVGNFNKSS